jgi:hypothetical protein
VHVPLEGVQTAQGLPGAVDVVHAPAAIPGTVRAVRECAR